MLSKIKDSYQFLILCALCIIFIILKYFTLNTPYFWDESWVYAPAIKAMAQSGISLMPHALSDFFSRGHPLFFFFTGAIWVKLLGSSFISLHLFALAIAISFIFTLFYIVKNLFDSTLALIVSAITLIQPNFISQSAIVLPEIFVSLWAVLTIYHFVKGNRFYYFLFGSLLMLTKESGIVIIASLMAYQCISFFVQKITLHSFKLFMVDSLFAFTPILPFIAFLIIQHSERGYYLYPEHVALLNFNWNNFQEVLKHCYDILFEGQGRILITWSFLIIFGLLYKPIPVFARWAIVIGLMVCVKIFFRYWPLPDWLMILFVGAFTCMFYYFMHIKYATASKQSEKFLATLFITGILYLVFSSINFFTNRYLLLLVPLMVIYFSYYIKTSIQFRPYLPYTWALVIVVLMICNVIFYCNSLGDDSPKYIHGIRLEQEMVKYMEQQHLQKSNIYSNFTMTVALHDKDCGFLTGDSIFTNLAVDLNKNTEYVVYTNVDFDTLWWKRSDTLPNFKIVKKFDYGIAHGRLFKRVL